MTPGTNPTLTLQVSAPNAIEQFRAMALAARELRSELALLQQGAAGGAGGGAAFTRLDAEVKELRAGMQALRLENENLMRQMAQQAEKAAAAVKQQQAAIVERGRAERDEIRKTAQAQKEAEDKLGARASLGSIRTAEGLRVGLGTIRQGSDDRALKEALDVQVMLLREQQAKMQRLNEDGLRQIEYQQVKSNDRLRALNLTGQREVELQARQSQERLRALNAAGQREIEYQQIQAQERGRALNLTGQRAIELAQARAHERLQALNEAGYRQELARKAKQDEELKALNEKGLRDQERQKIAAQERLAALDARFAAASPQTRLRQAQVAQELAARGVDPTNTVGTLAASAGNAAGIAALRGEIERLGNANKAAAGKATEHAEAAKALREEQAMLHAAARGAAAGMDALFLTYSRFIPLMVTAYATVKSIRESISRGMDFDYTLGFTAALSDEARNTGTERYKQQIDAQLRSVSEGTQFSARELAQGLRVLEQTGVEASKGVNLVGIAAQAAVMGEVDMKTATQDLVAVLNVFKLRSDDPVELQKNFQRVGDVMAEVAKNTQANLHDVAESLKNTTGLVSQYGVQLETTAAIVEQLGKSGIIGGKAGTFARQFLENIYTNQSTQAQSLKDFLKLSPIDSSTGELKRDVDYINEVLQKINSLDTESKLAAVRDLFNERGAKPARELLEAQLKSLETLGEAADKLRGKTGSLQEFNSALQGIAKIEWGKTLAAVDNLFTKAFEGAKPGIIDLAHTLKDIFTDPAVIEGMTAMMSVVGAMASAAGALARAAHEIRTPKERGIEKETANKTAGILNFLGYDGNSLVFGPTAQTRTDAQFEQTQLAEVRAEVARVDQERKQKGLVPAEEATDYAAAAQEYAAYRATVPAPVSRGSIAAPLTPEEQLKALADLIWPHVIQQESRGRQFDDNGRPLTSSAGAIGIAQLLPSTAPEAAKLAHLPFDPYRLRNDSDYNEALGKAYFEAQLRNFGGDPAKALAAYNAGPGATRAAIDKAAPTREDFLNFLKPETRDYVPSILSAAGVEGGTQIGGIGGLSLPLKLRDPIAAERQQQLSKAQVTEENAQIQRQRELSETLAQTELAHLSRLQQAKLISEEQYTSQVEEINKQRIQVEADATLASITRMQRERNEVLDNPAAKQAVDTRIKDAEAKLQQLMIRASAADQAAQDRVATIGVRRAEELRKEASQTTAVLAKAENEEIQLRERRDNALANRLRPEADVAAETAALETRQRFQDKILKTDQEIFDAESKAQKFREQGATEEAAHQDEIATGLRARKTLLEGLSDSQTALNAEQARGNVELQRSFTFGWAEAFNQYQQDATNAAKIAREAFANAARAMEDALTKFLTTGKFSFHDFVNVIEQELARMAARSIVSNAFGAIGGALGLTREGATASAGGTSPLSLLSSGNSLFSLFNNGSGALSKIGGFFGLGGSASGITGATMASSAVESGTLFGTLGGGLPLVDAANAVPMFSAATPLLGSIEGGAGLAGGAGALGAIGTALPYVGAALLAAKVFGLFGKSKPPTSDVSDFAAVFDKTGNVSNPFGKIQGGMAEGVVRGLEQQYQQATEALGLQKRETEFYFNVNQREGQLHSFRLAGGVAGRSSYYDSGAANGPTPDETPYSDQAAADAGARALLSAIVGSLDDAEPYLKNYFRSLVPENMDKASVDAALAFGSSLKTIREQLTLTPLEIAKKRVEEYSTALGTSAKTTDAWKAQFLQAIDAGTSPEAVAKWQALGNAIDEVNRLVGETADSAVAAVQRAAAAQQLYGDRISDLEGQLRSAYESQRSELEQTKQKFQDFAKSLREFNDQISLGDLSPLSPTARYNESKRQFQDVSSRAALGDPDAIGQLQNVSQQFLSASKEYNAFNAGYVADFNAVKEALSRTADVSDRQVAATDRSLAELKSQVEQLITLNDTAKTIAELIGELNAAIAGLVAGKTGEQIPPGSPMGQWLAAKSGNQVYLSQSDQGKAIAVLKPGESDYTVSAANGNTFTGTQARDFITGHVAAGDPFSVYQAARESGVSLADVDKIAGYAPGTAAEWAKANGLPGFATGGDAQGLFSAHERGPEILYSPSPVRVVSNQQSKLAVIEGGKLSEQMQELIGCVRVLVSQHGRGVEEQLDKLDALTATLENDSRVRKIAA
jgi:TP901 family phage tail tape measure protein/lambda family phage tail tape measure protein